jgi:hypothetical protein
MPPSADIGDAARVDAGAARQHRVGGGGAHAAAEIGAEQDQREGGDGERADDDGNQLVVGEARAEKADRRVQVQLETLRARPGGDEEDGGEYHAERQRADHGDGRAGGEKPLEDQHVEHHRDRADENAGEKAGDDQRQAEHLEAERNQRAGGGVLDERDVGKPDQRIDAAQADRDQSQVHRPDDDVYDELDHTFSLGCSRKRAARRRPLPPPVSAA